MKTQIQSKKVLILLTTAILMYSGLATLWPGRALAVTAPVLNVVSMTSNSAVLQWTPGDPTPGTNMGYNVAANHLGVGSTTPGTTVYSVTGLNCNQLYDFDVTLVYGNGLSAESNFVSRWTDPCNTPPSIPQGVSAVAASTTQIRVAWSQSTDSSTPAAAINYHIFRNNSEIAIKSGSEICPAGCAYTDNGLQPGTNYSYFIKADDGSLMSGPSATASAMTSQASSPSPVQSSSNSRPAPIKVNTAPKAQPISATSTPIPQSGPPPAPTNLVAQLYASRVVDLSWDVVLAANIDHYTVERSTDQATWQVLTTVKDNSFEDAQATFDTTYYYRVNAVDAASEVSAYATTQIKTTSAPKTPYSGDLTSEDGLVTATIPESAFDRNTSCSLTGTIDGLVTSSLKTSKKLLLGPYRLLCVQDDGSVATTLKKPARITIKTASLKAYTGFSIQQLNNKVWHEVKSNAGQDSLNFTSTSTEPFVLVGSKSINPWQFIGPILGLAIIGGIGFVALRLRQRAAANRLSVQQDVADFWNTVATKSACQHLAMVPQVSPLSNGCQECEAHHYKWEGLRMCLTCGHVGCSDGSIYQHAAQHARDSGHPLAMDHLDPDPNKVGWCYLDQTFVNVAR